ncbi:hypothetical protein H4R34_002451 [Dimargaris verticillata]|uniref:homogentisate 1,2-dioxygenase n=1 Tax=Dimargaris verticillata TaxID=2761393 RepID=A0A9W8B7Z5_9FUNG|nr:hypothetical protein H4R34_002451 [Dimargaris verticillata]
MPSTKPDNLTYLAGFGNHFSSEALPGALPANQNTPQNCPYGLYAEQLSGTAFTSPRQENRRTWLYRVLPSACHQPLVKAPADGTVVSPLMVANFSGSSASAQDGRVQVTPTQLRWKPFAIEPNLAHDFVQGLRTLAGAGDPGLGDGLAIHVYCCTQDMQQKAVYSADGDWLIVPQQGALIIQTEFGRMQVAPNEVCVIPRGIRYRVELPDGPSRGYILEVFKGHFDLPDLGPIGANGLANPRDFQTPVAAYDQAEVHANAPQDWQIVAKFQGEFFVADQDHTPFDVVAWHGNYVPFKYNLAHFCAVNSVTFDHMDPSIFTVLTCRSAVPGTALADFVIFPPRFEVQQRTFRPPYFHRNVMSEFMGIIHGQYEAKRDGFLPGGATLHSTMTPHGPDTATVRDATARDLQPGRVADHSQAFMFETCLMLKVTKWALEDSMAVDQNYYRAWSNMPRTFDPTATPKGSSQD